MLRLQWSPLLWSLLGDGGARIGAFAEAAERCKDKSIGREREAVFNDSSQVSILGSMELSFRFSFSLRISAFPPHVE